MTVCKFWLQGNCRFGDRCKYEHAQANRNPSTGNRFAALQSPENSRNHNGYQGELSNSQPIPYSLDKAAIVTDLSSERPQWILSAYGPGRHAPAQLFGGPLREQSFEEMRLLHYMGLAKGNPQQAIQDAEKVFQACESQMKTALEDIDGAISFIINAENQHPNRTDVLKDSIQGNLPQGSQQGSQQNPFGGSTLAQPPTTSGAFGAPSLNGQTTNPFGAPSQPGPPSNSFAAPNPAPNQPATAPRFGTSTQSGAFGQPSALGQKPNPFGATPAPVFGGPSQLGRGVGAFGSAPVLGQKANPFGTQPAAVGTGLSQPSGFSSFAGASNPFAARPSTSTPDAFNNSTNPSNPAVSGAAPQPSQANPFGQPASTSNTFNTSSVAPKGVFGAPNLQNSNPATLNAFGTPSLPAEATTKNPFGESSQRSHSGSSNPFGSAPGTQTTSFGGQTISNSNPFGGAPAQPAATQNPFSRAPDSNPFGGPPLGVNGVSKQGSDIPLGAPHPELSSYASKDSTGRLILFKGRRVQYKESVAGTIKPDGGWEKICFPDGAPKLNEDTELEEKAYGDSTKEAYEKMRTTGAFEDLTMPLLPPMRNWCLWDF